MRFIIYNLLEFYWSFHQSVLLFSTDITKINKRYWIFFIDRALPYLIGSRE